MKKLKLAIIPIVLLTSIILVRKNAATSTDAAASSDLATDMATGTCHFREQTNRTLLFDKDQKVGADKFRFVVNSREIAKVQPLLSKAQLIDLQRQLIVADSLYQDVLGLSDPLSKPRYQHARYIAVAMASIKGNGLAYDEVTADKALGPTDCRINIKLSATLQSS